jgi:hypothetical protein
MSVTTTNLIQGPATLYVGLFGAAEPADAAVNAIPAASAWTDMGATDGGVKLTVNQTYSVLNVDQIVDNPERRLTSREVSVQTNLAEPTMANLVIALNGGTAATATGVATYDPVASASAQVPTYSALILDGVAPGNFRRRVIVRKALNTQNVESDFKKDGQSYWTVTFSSHYVSTSIKPFRIIDQTA